MSVSREGESVDTGLRVMVARTGELNHPLLGSRTDEPKPYRPGDC